MIQKISIGELSSDLEYTCLHLPTVHHNSLICGVRPHTLLKINKPPRGGGDVLVWPGGEVKVGQGMGWFTFLQVYERKSSLLKADNRSMNDYAAL